jgi:hypothetical protein
VPHKIYKIGNSAQILLGKADQIIVDIVFGYGGFIHFCPPALTAAQAQPGFEIFFQDKGIQDFLDGSFVFFAKLINFLKSSQQLKFWHYVGPSYEFVFLKKSAKTGRFSVLGKSWGHPIEFLSREKFKIFISIISIA